MKVFAFGNNKGGITKTTSTVNLAYGLARRGYRTAVVDADAQCNSTYTLLGIDAIDYDDAVAELDTRPATLFDVIIGVNGDQRHRRNLADVIVPVPQQEGLYLAKGSVQLANADILLAASKGREKILHRALQPLADQFDVVLIDTPPTLGMMPVNAFVAARDGIIIPITPQSYSVLGIRTLEEALQQLRDEVELSIPIFGVVAAKVQRTKNATDRMKQVRGYFGELLFKTTIPINEKVEEASDMQVPLFTYAAKSTGAVAYAALVDEFVARAGL
jgi:chromosome partitioning protein